MLSVLYGHARDPVWVERVYVDGWGGTLATLLAALTAPVPWSVGELAIGALVVYELLLALTAASEVGSGRRRWHHALLGGALHVVDVALLLTTVFYLVWGVAYARPPAIARLGWEDLAPEGDGAGPEAVVALRALVVDATARTHAAYEALHGTLDAGEVTAPREGLDLDAALDVGFTAAGAALGLSEGFGSARGRAKVPLASEVMSYAGIGGIYLPFTGEAHVNGGPPGWTRVFTTAHEKAHQRMIASEDEASFFGFLACVYAEDPLLRYAGWQFARGQLLQALHRVDEAAAQELAATLAPGPARDRRAQSEYWKSYEGWLEELSRAMNDRYLKVNRVHGGVLAYGRAGRLIVGWARSPAGASHLGGPPPDQPSSPNTAP